MSKQHFAHEIQPPLCNLRNACHTSVLWKYNIHIEPSQAKHSEANSIQFKPSQCMLTKMSMDLYRTHILFVYYFYQWRKSICHYILTWSIFRHACAPYIAHNGIIPVQVPYRLLYRNKWTIFMGFFSHSHCWVRQLWQSLWCFRLFVPFSSALWWFWL